MKATDIKACWYQLIITQHSWLWQTKKKTCLHRTLVWLNKLSQLSLKIISLWWQKQVKTAIWEGSKISIKMQTSKKPSKMKFCTFPLSESFIWRRKICAPGIKVWELWHERKQNYSNKKCYYRPWSPLHVSIRMGSMWLWTDMDFQQRIPQNHKPTSQNIVYWEWPISCRRTTPVVSLQSCQQRERET